MGNLMKKYAEADTPTTNCNWKNLSDEDRLRSVYEKIRENEIFLNIDPQKATENGKVTVVLTEKMPARKRGILLLDLERCLKDTIDQGINVWCETIGDKNSLRNLRGIEIKS
jgi:hypothetical protein